MYISERYDQNENLSGNIRWHTRTIGGKKFQFVRESENGCTFFYVYGWLEDADLEIIDFERVWDESMSWDNAPTKVVKYTGFSPYPLHSFSNEESL